MFRAYLLTAALAFSVSGCATPKATENQNAPPDWLLAQGDWPAQIEVQDGQLTLQNGLIRRVIKLSPNAATVAFDNLMTGESMLRSPKPEARVTLDGLDLAVGGLAGQPDHAFLLPDWIDSLQDDPASFQYVGHRVGQTKAPFGWKRNRHEEGRPWPAPGVSLEMDYRLDDLALNALGNRLAGPNAKRELLLHENFQSNEAAWSFVLSQSDERNSLINEGKFGEIYARENSYAFMERKLPASTQAVECQIDSGTDASASWGPGMTLVWPNGQTLKVFLRPGQKQFGVNLNGNERTFSGLDVAKSWWLRVEIQSRGLICMVSANRKDWRELMVVNDAPTTAPSTVRLGKADRSGKPSDYADVGELGRSRLLDFAAYGQLTGAAADELQEKLQRLAQITVTIRYEIFDGIPLLGKELLIKNDGSSSVQLNSFISELLAAVEAESRVEGSARWRPAGLDVVSDYSFGGMSPINSSKVVHWVPDPEYMTQVNYQRLSPVLLETRLPAGPNVPIASGETFRSFRVFELAQDSTDRERKGLARRQMYRTIAPWVTENPLMMHIRSADPTAVKLALDQCEAVGFEMAILTFGSGFNIESEDPAYLAQLKELADYAHERGIQLGGYSLLASRRISKEHDVVDKETGETGHAFFGNSPCLESEWGKEYFRKLYDFYEKTGFDLLEHDGSYPGDFCASTTHPGHSGYEDSQWLQWTKIRDFYQWCREEGIFLNVPDFYVLAGSNKTGMGYRETNWSLPRALQPLHGRQNVYDGTWEKTPTMGWMFVPLTQYQGGGAAATLEPLKDHLDAYESHLAYNLGFGVQACWRGPRLFDSPQTEALIKKWVDFYKSHRPILESDLLHLRRADGRDLDYMMHVNPRLDEKALLMVFNPLNETRTKTIRVPMYYAGLSTTTQVSQEGAAPKLMRINRDFTIDLEVTVAPQSQTWFLFKD